MAGKARAAGQGCGVLGGAARPPRDPHPHRRRRCNLVPLRLPQRTRRPFTSSRRSGLGGELAERSDTWGVTRRARRRFATQRRRCTTDSLVRGQTLTPGLPIPIPAPATTPTTPSGTFGDPSKRSPIQGTWTGCFPIIITSLTSTPGDTPGLLSRRGQPTYTISPMTMWILSVSSVKDPVNGEGREVHRIG